jgi:hypothetical protein
MNINLQARVIDNAGKLAAKYFKREDLRNFCREYGIHFNLRSTKSKMAREIIKFWLQNDRIDKITEVIEGSYNHWQGKIDSKDPHKPGYYRMMRDIALHARELLKEKVAGV